jgi:hypothetical protein
VFLIKNVDGIKGLYLDSGTSFIKGACLWTLNGSIIIEPTQTSIKVSDDVHIEDDFGQYLNHSCRSTVRIEVKRVIAVKDLSPGDELAFDYRDNEDSLVVPFTCKCCGNYIK